MSLSYDEYKKLFESLNLSKLSVSSEGLTIKAEEQQKVEVPESESDDDITGDLVGTLGLIPPKIATEISSDLKPVTTFQIEPKAIAPVPTASNAPVAAGAKVYKTTGVAMWCQYRKLNYPLFKAQNPTNCTLQAFTSHASKQWKQLTKEQKEAAHLTAGLHYNPAL